MKFYINNVIWRNNLYTKNMKFCKCFFCIFLIFRKLDGIFLKLILLSSALPLNLSVNGFSLLWQMLLENSDRWTTTFSPLKSVNKMRIFLVEKRRENKNKQDFSLLRFSTIFCHWSRTTMKGETDAGKLTEVHSRKTLYTTAISNKIIFLDKDFPHYYYHHNDQILNYQ